VRRLRRKRLEGQTDDQLINEILDALPMERVSPDIIRLHKRRMKSSNWKSLDEIRKSLGEE